MEIVAIIPARYKSSRFPGKALAEIAGKPMIERVYYQVTQVDNLDRVIVATDDERIYKTVTEFGGEVKMTSSCHQSGTDRIAEVARDLECDLIVNVQGDEPVIDPEMIEQAMAPFYENNNLKMGTLKKRIKEKVEINDPNIVKVITDDKNNALYFSRSPIPYQRGEEAEYYKHIGLYVYQREFLIKYSQMKPTRLEKTESLEQLRALENGYNIKVVETKLDSIGVDTPEDIARVEELL